MNTRFILMFILLYLLALACNSNEVSEETTTEATQATLSFQQRKIVDSTQHWWAHCPTEINGDDITDLVFIHNNSSGGYLGYYAGQKDTGLWALNVIAEAPPTGGLFAAGDLECADMDGDGDVDVFAVKHPGEWKDAGAEAELFWYENPSWEVHAIGTIPDALKDVSFADFDLDGKMDIGILTFEENTLSIFQQQAGNEWKRVQYFQNFGNLHEGMGIGDVNGDQYPEIVANGWIFHNLGKSLEAEWKVENLDERWNSQTVDWSRNATKCFLRDLDGDGKMEVFMSHSERGGYPLVWYKKEQDQWKANIISDSIPACHTLQVVDFDKDGDYDVLAGVNGARAVNIGHDDHEVTVFLSENNYASWTPMVIEENGIYNGQVADYDKDGDFDIFRYPNHEATAYYLLENQLE